MKKRISLIVIVFAALILSSCSTSNKSNDASNLEIVEQYHEALKNFDYETMKTFLADYYVMFGPSLGDSMNREDALLNWKYNIEHIYEKLEYKGSQNFVVTSYASGEAKEWVSSWGRLFIKYKDHGNEAEILSNTIYQIENGKIVKSYIFYNEADALRQAGYNYVFREPVKLDE